ncbi:Uncharacterised protein [Candidatus Gugararchaeum adminiculabundum]|nr:Uncharacterised protein [Candidatus Gugararchaeum adminiculabundum]
MRKPILVYFLTLALIVSFGCTNILGGGQPPATENNSINNTPAPATNTRPPSTPADNTNQPTPAGNDTLDLSNLPIETPVEVLPAPKIEPEYCTSVLTQSTFTFASSEDSTLPTSECTLISGIATGSDQYLSFKSPSSGFLRIAFSTSNARNFSLTASQGSSISTHGTAGQLLEATVSVLDGNVPIAIRGPEGQAFQILLEYVPTPDEFEPNNDASYAKAVSLGEPQKAYLFPPRFSSLPDLKERKDVDYYKVKVSTGGNLIVDVSTVPEGTSVKIGIISPSGIEHVSATSGFGAPLKFSAPVTPGWAIFYITSGEKGDPGYAAYSTDPYTFTVTTRPGIN